MQLTYLTEQDWQTLEERYPSAAAYLLHQSLYRERIALRSEFLEISDKMFGDARRHEWLRQRINELDTITLANLSAQKE